MNGRLFSKNYRKRGKICQYAQIVNTTERKKLSSDNFDDRSLLFCFTQNLVTFVKSHPTRKALESADLFQTPPEMDLAMR